jgi:exopolyphosphatase/guanosine-5'-triphosphate,3'-diphosphate pyrophosphatase
VFLALAVYFRYAGIGEKNQPRTGLSVLLTPAMSERARLVGQMLRVAHLVSAAHPGVLPATHFRSQGRKLILAFDRRIGGLVGDRIANRFKQLARLVGRSAMVEVR